MSKTLSRLKREGGISLETLQQKRASSCVEGRISWFFSSCGRKFGVPLELRCGPQGPDLVASVKPVSMRVARVSQNSSLIGAGSYVYIWS